MIFVTGGAGFIGSNFILEWFSKTTEALLNLDNLTYAGNLANLESVNDKAHYHFVKGDINDRTLLNALFDAHKPRALINFAAESHVDRSIHGPAIFIKTNIEGTFALLETAKEYWSSLAADDREKFRFLHVSTDEVYGSLDEDAPPFSETHPYQPNSPYSASKAASDHLVRAWHHTYGFPVLTTNCSNNYGPYQFPEKLIPLTIARALQNKNIPIYGDGKNIRDWLYVGDHCNAIMVALNEGKVGETYNIGGWNEIKNIDIVTTICDLLDELRPDALGPYKRLITFIQDRPGHDRRYAINATKIHKDLGWHPQETFYTGIRKTVEWYLSNQDWVKNIESGSYQNWIQKNYSNCL
ncbi:MAG: dTDP-glucose 4,6-dehydratase [Alphaproteobacteria bacterium]|nr:dTDP-glucose 4,6-dehydratase [Alphaproteobacteria bacterium]